MKKLYIVRHAETEMNVAGLFSGHTETDLTGKGRGQASSAGKTLAEGPLVIDLMIASPTRRTRQTATLIAGQISYDPEKIEYLEDLIERNFGDLEGTPGQEFWSHHTGKAIDKVPNAETAEQMGQRSKRVLDMVRKRPEKNILLVTHGAFGRALIREVKGIPHHHEHRLAHRMKYRIGNAEIIQLI